MNGKRNGEGMFTYLNKDIYSGNWKNGKKHGQGTYVYFDTQSRVRLFKKVYRRILWRQNNIR